MIPDPSAKPLRPPVGWFGLNPYDGDATRRDDPYPALDALREEHPVHQTPRGFYRVLRHEDVLRVLKGLPVGVRTTDGVLPGVDESLGPRRFMLMQDPPDHTRLRRIVSRGFAPPRLAALRDHVQALVDGFLDEVSGERQIDVVEQLARPLPSTVICEMLGVPVEDRVKFTDWTAHVTHLLAPLDTLPKAVLERAQAASMGLFTYMSELIEARRSHLSDDLLSVMIRAEEDGDALSTDELLTQSVGLLVAGFETTIGLIGNGVRQLLLHPTELRKLRADPGLIESTVEECLRFDGPVAGTRRVLHEDAEIGGYTIPKDSEIVLSIAAAHRDPRVFERPETFDIERKARNHLAFGGGIHFCLGAHLARLESQIAIGSLVRRYRALELVHEKPVWSESLFRIQGSLEVHATPA